MPRQRHEDRADREALAARAHDLRTLLAGTRPSDRGAARLMAHYQAELLQIEKLLPLLTDNHAATEARGEQDEDMVTVGEAARLAGVSTSRVHAWIARGKLVAQPGGARGRLVSRAAVQTLAAATAPPPPREPLVPPPGTEEYMPPFVAARVAGVSRSVVSNWAKQGSVASRPGPYGQLVRLADVLTVAAERGLGGGPTAGAQRDDGVE